MSRTLIFVAEFTKSKVKTTPANAPTIDIADMLAPTGSLLVSAGSPTQITNMTGVYIYSYSAADSVLPVALMRTADTTVDLQDVPCLALAYDANGFIKADVEDWKNSTAPAMTGDAYARLGAPSGASVSADIATVASYTDSIESRLPAALTADGNIKADALKLNGSAPNNLASSDVQSAMTSQGYTSTRAGYLDVLNGLIAAIWSYATHLLTAGTNIVLAKGTGVTGFTDLSQADVRTAVGMASANLDAQLAAIPTTSEIDTELSGVHGSGAWGPSGSSGANTVTLTIEDADTSDTLADVLVTVKDSGDTTLIDQKRTANDGTATFSLDDATYKIHVSALPGYQSLAAQTLVVNGNEAATYELTPLAVGAPSAPDLCRVYGYEYLNGNAVEGRKILAYLQGAPQASGTVLLEQVPDQTETDADGYWYLDLVSNKEYKIKVDGAGVNQVFTIPDVVSVNLKDLL